MIFELIDYFHLYDNTSFNSFYEDYKQIDFLFGLEDDVYGSVDFFPSSIISYQDDSQEQQNNNITSDFYEGFGI